MKLPAKPASSLHKYGSIPLVLSQATVHSQPLARALIPKCLHGRYTANKDLARRAPPDQAVWKRVLEAMQLTPEQLEALAEVQQNVKGLRDMDLDLTSAFTIPKGATEDRAGATRSTRSTRRHLTRSRRGGRPHAVLSTCRPDCGLAHGCSTCRASAARWSPSCRRCLTRRTWRCTNRCRPSRIPAQRIRALTHADELGNP